MTWKVGERVEINKDLDEYKKGDKGTIIKMGNCESPAGDYICDVLCGRCFINIKWDNGNKSDDDCFGYNEFILSKLSPETLRELIGK